MSRLIKLLAGVVLVAVVAACSEPAVDTTTTGASDTSAASDTTTGGEASPGDDLAFLQRAMAASADDPASRIEGSVSIVLPDQAGSADMPMTVILDPETGNSTVTMDLAAMAVAGGEQVPAELADMMGTMEVREIGDTVYLRFPFLTAFLGAETDWVSMPAEQGEDMTGDLGSGAAPSDPGSLLENLADVDGSVERLGREEIRDIGTTHFRLIVDESWQEQLTEEQLEELESQGPLPDSSFPMDLWIDDQGRVHRMATTLEVSGEEEFSQMTMTFDFFDFGRPQTIQAPPADQVTDMSELEGPLGSLQP